MTDYYAAYAFYKASGLPDAEAHTKAEEDVSAETEKKLATYDTNL